MDHLDDLPKRHKNHVTESKAEAALHELLSSSEDFVLQASDRKDYGTDCQIEVFDRESATNVRIHVQLKGAESAPNADGSISVEIKRSNLNYLLMQPHAVFVCYHVPSDRLLYCSTDAVVQKYDHSGQGWTEQKTLTVTFSERLTKARLKSLATLAKFSAVSSRNLRVRQIAARPEDLPGILKSAIPDLHVPDDEARAVAMLSSIYESGENGVISAAFDRFLGVLQREHPAMVYCYMAEINLAMNGQAKNVGRIEDGISHFKSMLGAGQYHLGGLYYSMGNGLAAIGRDLEAIDAFEIALGHLSGDDSDHLLAECFKNLGSSYEKVGNQDKAVEYFREALRHRPRLPEALQALGSHYLKVGEYAEALKHFDQIVYSEHTPGKRSSVSGWRLDALFNLGDGKSAFREIGILLSTAAEEAWIWPWCARLVASFGRTSVENAKLSIPFWQRYLDAHPKCPSGLRELLLNKLYLRSNDQASDLTYVAFKAEFEMGISYVEREAAALLWDQLGHWAQDDENWQEAERCFRFAYEFGGGHYGYCLGTALNVLDRPEESLPILLSQAEAVESSGMSWFQIAVAYCKLGRVQESVEAYQKVIAFDPDNYLAWFNMGGVHWSAGEPEQAVRVWKVAAQKFPDSELAERVRRDFSFALR